MIDNYYYISLPVLVNMDERISDGSEYYAIDAYYPVADKLERYSQTSKISLFHDFYLDRKMYGYKPSLYNYLLSGDCLTIYDNTGFGQNIKYTVVNYKLVKKNINRGRYLVQIPYELAEDFIKKNQGTLIHDLFF